MTNIKTGRFNTGKPAIGHTYVNPYPNPDPSADGSVPTLPFPNSIFTKPVPASPVLAANSAKLVSNFIYQYQNNFNGVAVNNYSATPTRYVVHGNSFPWQLVKVNPGNRWAGAPQGTIMAPIPPNAVPDPAGTDRQMTIWNLDPDPITGVPMWWDFWKMDINAGWQCSTFVRSPADSTFNGVYPWGGEPSNLATSAGAAHLSYGGGLITAADIKAGAINHAINIAMPQTGIRVLPATQYDGSNVSTSVPEGTRFYFPASVTMPGGLPPIAQMVFQAIKTYGAYIMDTSGSVNAYAEHQLPWINFQGTYPIGPSFNGVGSYTLLTGLPWSQMVAVSPMSGNAIVAGDTLPTAPTLSATAGSAGSGQINLSWTVPASSGTAGINAYYAYWGTSSNGQAATSQATITAPTTTYTASLTSGTTYYFKVAGVTNSGVGIASNELSVTAP